MRFHVLTLFPQMIEQGLSESITGRALKQNIISLNTVNIRDFAHNKHNKVDDYTYRAWWRCRDAYAGRAGVSGCAQCGESDQ